MYAVHFRLTSSHRLSYATTKPNIKVTQMNEDHKLEYQELRDEFALLTQMIATTMNFSVAGCILILSFIFPKIETENSISLYWLPLLVIYPSCLLIASRIQSMHRIAAYIIVFIEPISGLKWESRLLNFKHNKKLQFRKTILLIYLALMLFDIAIFSFKGYYHFIDILCYFVSLFLFVLIYRMMMKGWQVKYIDIWKDVKAKEESI